MISEKLKDMKCVQQQFNVFNGQSEYTSKALIGHFIVAIYPSPYPHPLEAPCPFHVLLGERALGLREVSFIERVHVLY